MFQDYGINISFGGANINASALSGNTLEGMANGGISQLCFLISSVLEPELFLIAIELDSRLIQPIPKEAILGQDPAPPAKKTENRAAAKPYAQKADFSIRLDISFINNFMDVANEMILTRNRLMTLTRAHAKSITGLTPVLNSVSRLTSEVQEKVMRARMQPVGVIFNKFPRIIRDAAKTLGKDIRLEISGADIALDKYMLDSLTDPITQIVKNAADHGIESAERRAKAQKPPQGSIALNACMRDGMAVIEITDDGAGIDPERLKQTAMERGAFSEERLAAMTKDELFALIFEPGLLVTDVSGRGVGMDIVKTNIERLGGTIEIESTPNAGTAMRIKVPLTLSVVRTLIIKIDGVQYAVPESNVARIVRVSTKSASQFAWVNGSPIINIDGWIVPLITLCGDAPDGELPEYVNPDAAKCLILKSGSRYFALLIEDALETEETLIKPLPIYLKSCRIYSGVTVLGSGSAIMVLDARGLLRSSGLSGVEMPPEESAAPAENTEQVIVFACSGPEYYAVNANYVTRIVRFEAGRIQEIDDALYVSIADKAIRLIRTEDYAPVQKLPYLKKWLYLVLLDSGAQPAGLLADHVLDKVQAVLPLDNNVEGEYILGTSIHGEKILIHLDSARILEAALLHENLAVAERRCASSEA